MAKETDVAYLAGLVDGEGCIRVKRSKPYRSVTGRQSPSYNCSIHVRMVDEDAIAFLKQTLGGWYWREKGTHAANGRPLYCWQATDKEAERILRSLLPFLRVKRASAENALALRELQATSKQHRTKVVGYRNFTNQHGAVRRIENRAYSDEYLAACDALHARSCELNRVGV